MDAVTQKYFNLFEKLEAEYDEYSEFLSAVEIMSDNKLFVHYLTKRNQVKNIATAFKKYKQLLQDILVANELLQIEEDENERNVLKNKIQEIETEATVLFEEIKSMYYERGEKANQKTKIEISYKAGDKLFVVETKEMFQNFANENELKVEIISETESQISLYVIGENSYEVLKNFNGAIKKVQNGNESLILVVALLSDESEIEFKEEDIEIQISKSSGAGGQHINKTESAVKLIHIPTGITAECQDERSQGKNKEKAMAALKQKILQKSKENNEKYIKNQRNSMKTAIFSDTAVLIFDFDRNRVVDNRTKKNYEIKDIIQGNLKIIASDLIV